MSITGQDIINRVAALGVYRRGERRAPHKPLLLLDAIAKLFEGQTEIPFPEVKDLLLPQLNAFAPPVAGKHQPELPFWYLRNDGLWEIPGADSFPLTKARFPAMAHIQAAVGRFPEEVAALLSTDRQLAMSIVHLILENHFPESLHDDILVATGVGILFEKTSDEPLPVPATRRRDPHFREKILTAYEHRCAVTGFRAALGGSFFGCEAAHVQWHAYDGPDTIENGLSLEPTLHKLFDAGAWSLTDDHVIIVSSKFTGSDQAIERLRSFHGKPLRDPIPGEPAVSPEFIQWHREADLGGVFRAPALRH